MPNLALGDVLVFAELAVVEIDNRTPTYGTLGEATAYFSDRVDAQLWLVSDAATLTKCMVTATRAIDDLRFWGEPTEEDQPLQFPRDGATVVPEAIKRACFEEAFSLLRKRVADTEYSNLFVTSRVFDKVRTNYDYARAPEHVVAGITSRTAWTALRPYLCPNRTLNLRRGS